MGGANGAAAHGVNLEGVQISEWSNYKSLIIQ